MADIGIAIALITAIGVFVGPLLTSRLQQMRRERDKKLRTHFENLKSEIIDPIIYVTDAIENRDDKIVYENWPITVERPIVLPNYKFEQRDSFACFSLHFPVVADEWKQLKERSLKQNQSAEDFENKIKEHIGSDHNLPPLKKESTGIEEMIIDVTPKCLCQTLHELAQNSSLVYDFTKAEIKRIDSFYVLHFPKIVTGVSQLVYTKTVEKVEYSKSVLVGIQESPDFRQEASHILHNAEKLVKDSKDFSSRLAADIDNISKYEIGKRFKKHKKCPICERF